MPRALPWDAEDAEEKAAKKKSASALPPKRKAAEADSDEDLVDFDLNPIRSSTPEKKLPKKRTDRTPSTSPAPAPPAVVYMREGYQADDIWRMVEDEFYSTAQTFTQHIHRAEYLRLRRLAKSRGKEVLQSVVHGTDGRTERSGEMKRKLEVKGNAKKRKAAMRGSDSEETSEDEDAYAQDPQLAVLMKGVQPVGKDLGLNLDKSRAKTRAAAGFSQSPRNVERTRDVFKDTTAAPSASAFGPNGTSGGHKASALDLDFSADEEDLDAPPTRAQRPTSARAGKRRMESSDGPAERSKTNGLGVEKGKSIFAQFAKPIKNDSRNGTSSSTARTERAATTTERACPATSTAKKPATTTSSDHLERSTKNASSEDAASQLRARYRAERERKEREKQRKAKAADDIPTFLF